MFDSVRALNSIPRMGLKDFAHWLWKWTENAHTVAWLYSLFTWPKAALSTAAAILLGAWSALVELPAPIIATVGLVCFAVTLSVANIVDAMIARRKPVPATPSSTPPKAPVSTARPKATLDPTAQIVNAMRRREQLNDFAVVLDDVVPLAEKAYVDFMNGVRSYTPATPIMAIGDIFRHYPDFITGYMKAIEERYEKVFGRKIDLSSGQRFVEDQLTRAPGEPADLPHNFQAPLRKTHARFAQFKDGVERIRRELAQELLELDRLIKTT